MFFFLAEGKPIPTELRNEEAELRHQIDLEDESTAGMVFFFIYLFLFWCLVCHENVVESVWLL